MDARVIGERSDAVLRTATPGHDSGGWATTELPFNIISAAQHPLSPHSLASQKKAQPSALSGPRFAGPAGLVPHRKGEGRERRSGAP